jgi:aminomethyltransferase
MSATALRATPLNSVHRALGAKMVDFSGWDMPVQYSGVIDEHWAVRNAVGIFDVREFWPQVWRSTFLYAFLGRALTR